MYLNKFINNVVVGSAVVYIPYYTIVTTENLSNNVLLDNSAAYAVYVTPLNAGMYLHLRLQVSSLCSYSTSYLGLILILALMLASMQIMFTVMD